MGVDGVENGFGQRVGFQQASELEQRGGIRCGLPAQINPDKTSESLALRPIPGLHPGYMDGTLMVLYRRNHVPGGTYFLP